jgi:hypothetical protein
VEIPFTGSSSTYSVSRPLVNCLRPKINYFPSAGGLYGRQGENCSLYAFGFDGPCRCVFCSNRPPIHTKAATQIAANQPPYCSERLLPTEAV